MAGVPLRGEQAPELVALLSTSTLDSLARLTVPTLADWCDIQMLDNAGVLRRVSMIHSDPALVARAEEH